MPCYFLFAATSALCRRYLPLIVGTFRLVQSMPMKRSVATAASEVVSWRFEGCCAATHGVQVVTTQCRRRLRIKKFDPDRTRGDKEEGMR